MESKKRTGREREAREGECKTRRKNKREGERKLRYGRRIFRLAARRQRQRRRLRRQRACLSRNELHSESRPDDTATHATCLAAFATERKTRTSRNGYCCWWCGESRVRYHEARMYETHVIFHNGMTNTNANLTSASARLTRRNGRIIARPSTPPVGTR